MKKIICITISLIIALIPCFSFASMQYTNYDNIFYDNEYNGFFDTNSGDYMDLSFLPEDLIISDDIVTTGGAIINESTPDEWTIPFSPEEINVISDEDAACTVNGANYSSLQNAFDELPSDKTLTIELCTDAYVQTALLVPSGYHITILLNSYDIISEANYAFICDGDLTIIGAGNVFNSLGGGIYNRNSGLVRFQAGVIINSKEQCLVNNSDGSIVANSDCNLITAAQNPTRQLNIGAGTIKVEALFGQEDSSIEEITMLKSSPMRLGSILPRTDNISYYHDKIWIGDFGLNLVIADITPRITFADHTFAELYANPYIYFDEGSYFELGAGFRLGLAFYSAGTGSNNQFLTWTIYNSQDNSYWRAAVSGLRFNAIGKYSELNIAESPTVYVGEVKLESFYDNPSNNCRTLYFKASNIHTSLNGTNVATTYPYVALTGVLGSNVMSCSQSSNLVPNNGYRIAKDCAINLSSSYFLTSKCTYNDFTYPSIPDPLAPFIADVEYEADKTVSIPYSSLYSVTNENLIDFINSYGLQLSENIYIYPKIIYTSGDIKYLGMAFYNVLNNASYSHGHNSTNYNFYEFRIATESVPYSSQTGSLDFSYKTKIDSNRFIYTETTISNVYRENNANASVGVLRNALCSTDDYILATYADNLNHLEPFGSSYIGAVHSYTSTLFSNEFSLKDFSKLKNTGTNPGTDPDTPHHDLDREGLDGIFNAGLEILQRIAGVILDPPYVYILGFVLLVLITIILKKIFTKW